MAWSRRIVLVIGTGLAAGALFAGLTTRSIHSSLPESAYQSGHERAVANVDSAPAEQSWLERGFAVIGGPAWPFGQHAWDPGPDDRDDEELDRSLPGYAPYPPGDDNAGRSGNDYGLALHDGDGSGYTQGDRYIDQNADSQEYADGRQAPAQDGSAIAGAPADEAARAAARAGDAAKDVIAAERAN